MYILIFHDSSTLKFSQYALDKMVANSVARITPSDEKLIVDLISDNELYIILDNIFNKAEALEIANDAYAHYIKKVFQGI
jgi:hypothetical protein